MTPFGLPAPDPTVEVRRLNSAGTVVQVSIAGRRFAVCLNRQGTDGDVELLVNEFVDGDGIKRHVTEKMPCL